MTGGSPTPARGAIRRGLAGAFRTLPPRVPAAVLTAALSLLLLVASARPLLLTIEDADFFWHLETGTWIVEHRALPQEFLFSLTATAPMTDNQRVTMTSYWLVQALYAVLHAAGGMTAIALLRAALLALLVGSLVARSPRGDPAALLAGLLLGVVVMRIFPFERPQIFSFLFLSLLLLALDRLILAPSAAAAARWAFAVLPTLMLVWANCHGGFIVGQGVLLLYAAGEGLKFARPGLAPLPRARYRLLLAGCGCGTLAAFVNPNTWRVHLAAFLPAWSKAGNVDYDSTVAYFQTFGGPVMPVFWLMLLLALAGLIRDGKRPDITRLALVAGTGAVAFGEIRHIPFFMVSAVPGLVAAASADGGRGSLRRTPVLAAALLAGLWLLPGDLAAVQDYRGANKVNGRLYPADAADFIRSRGLTGGIYSFPSWGGYLLWRLSPTRVFVDGRNSSYEVHRLNAAIESGDAGAPSGDPPWSAILDAYRVGTVVVPLFNPVAGYVPEVLFALGNSREWAPVFIGVNAVVFVALTEATTWATPPADAPREEFFKALVRRCEDLIAMDPANPFPRVARGDLLARLRRVDEARAEYQAALRLLPLNRLVRERIAALPVMAR